MELFQGCARSIGPCSASLAMSLELALAWFLFAWGKKGGGGAE